MTQIQESAGRKAPATLTGSSHASAFKSALPRYGFVLLSLVIAVLIWQAVAVWGGFAPYVLPKPTLVSQTIQLRSSLLFSNTWVTLEEVALGFSLAVLTGIPLALLIARFPRLNDLLTPLLVGLQIVPKIAIAPLFVVWFGFGISPKVLMTLLIAFFPILINSLTGFTSETPAMRDLAKIMGLSAWAHFRKVQLPNALPTIFSGLKVGLTFAVIGAIVGEFVGAKNGLGYVLVLANGNLDTALIFASIVFITVLGLVLYAIVASIEVVSMPWHVSRR
jgi:NitT/TauT family transport system permease protein